MQRRELVPPTNETGCLVSEDFLPQLLVCKWPLTNGGIEVKYTFQPLPSNSPFLPQFTNTIKQSFHLQGSFYLRTVNEVILEGMKAWEKTSNSIIQFRRVKPEDANLFFYLAPSSSIKEGGKNTLAVTQRDVDVKAGFHKFVIVLPVDSAFPWGHHFMSQVVTHELGHLFFRHPHEIAPIVRQLADIEGGEKCSVMNYVQNIKGEDEYVKIQFDKNPLFNEELGPLDKQMISYLITHPFDSMHPAMERLNSVARDSMTLSFAHKAIYHFLENLKHHKTKERLIDPESANFLADMSAIICLNSAGLYYPSAIFGVCILAKYTYSNSIEYINPERVNTALDYITLSTLILNLALISQYDPVSTTYFYSEFAASSAIALLSAYVGGKVGHRVGSLAAHATNSLSETAYAAWNYFTTKRAQTVDPASLHKEADISEQAHKPTSISKRWFSFSGFRRRTTSSVNDRETLTLAV